MTKDKALYAWLNKFMPFYPTTSVPDDVVFPYGTYELITDSIWGGEVGATVNLWFYTDSEADPNARAQDFAQYIGPGGTVISCDEGYIWVKRGTPWCQSVVDEKDAKIKRRYINVIIEYLTKN